MSRYFSRTRCKGTFGFILLIIIFMFCTGVFLLAAQLTGKGIVTTQNTIYINMEVDDRGTELLGLMNSETGDESYMKKLGNMIATNAAPDLGDEIKATLDKIQSIYAFRLQYSGMADKIFSKGDASDGNEYSMETPVPGARPEKVKAYVKLKR